MKDITKEINNAIRTNNASKLPTFCIVKDVVYNRITKETFIEYSFITSPTNRGCTVLKNSTAEKLIGLCGLVPSFHKEGKGTVYDTHDGRYKAKYHGTPVSLQS